MRIGRVVSDEFNLYVKKPFLERTKYRKKLVMRLSDKNQGHQNIPELSYISPQLGITQSKHKRFSESLKR